MSRSRRKFCDLRSFRVILLLQHLAIRDLEKSTRLDGCASRYKVRIYWWNSGWAFAQAIKSARDHKKQETCGL